MHCIVSYYLNTIINKEKTGVLVCSRNEGAQTQNIIPDDDPRKQVNTNIYLGSKITEDATSPREE